MTPDPYQASGGPSDPGSWNRYTYTRGDPVNRVDALGLMDDPTGCQDDGCGGGGGGDPGFGGDPIGYCPPSEQSCAPFPSGGGPSGGGGGTGGFVPPVTLGTDATLLDLELAGAVTGFTDSTTGITLTISAADWTLISEMCIAQPEVCALVAGGGLAIYVGYKYGPALIQALDNTFYRNKTSDPVAVPRGGTVSRNAAGNCQRPTQWKWEAAGNAHGSTTGSHWHWLTWNLADPTTCTYYPTRGSGPNDPGPDYVLFSGPMTPLP